MHPAQVLHSGDLICEGIIRLQAAPEAKAPKEDAKAPKVGEEEAIAAAPAAVEAPVPEASKEAVSQAAPAPVSRCVHADQPCMALTSADSQGVRLVPSGCISACAAHRQSMVLSEAHEHVRGRPAVGCSEDLMRQQKGSTQRRCCVFVQRQPQHVMFPTLRACALPLLQEAAGADLKGKRKVVDIHAQTETECSEIPSEGGSSAAPAPATPAAQEAATPEVRTHIQPTCVLLLLLP